MGVWLVFLAVCMALAIRSSYLMGYHTACARWHEHMANSWELVGNRLKERGWSEAEDFLEAFGRPPEGV